MANPNNWLCQGYPQTLTTPTLQSVSIGTCEPNLGYSCNFDIGPIELLAKNSARESGNKIQIFSWDLWFKGTLGS